MEDNLIERQPPQKTISKEEDLNGSWPQWKMTSTEEYLPLIRTCESKIAEPTAYNPEVNYVGNKDWRNWGKKKRMKEEKKEIKERKKGRNK